MRRAWVCIAAATVVAGWSGAARAQEGERHHAYLPYLRRDATPTPTATWTPSPTQTPDPLACGVMLSDPSIETAAGNEIVENTTINLFPNDDVWTGVIDGEHWLTATKGQYLPLIDADGAARTDKWALSFRGDATVGTGMAFAKTGIGVRTDDSVISAAVSLWYRLFANGDDGLDRLLIEAVGFETGDQPIIGIKVVRELPYKASEMRDGWTHEVVDFTPYVHGFIQRDRRWNMVGLRIVSSDGDGRGSISNWIIDDVQLHVCFR